MAPEAARGGRSDQRSDVFQLGMIISELLSGQRPHWAPDGTRLVIAERICDDLGKPRSLITYVPDRPGQVDRHIGSTDKVAEYGLAALVVGGLQEKMLHQEQHEQEVVLVLLGAVADLHD